MHGRDYYIARCIINAKIASDAGKHKKNPLLVSNASKPILKNGYADKDYFMWCAISAIIGSKNSRFRFVIEKGDIAHSYSIHFINFNPKYGRLIISFHSFDKGYKKFIRPYNFKMDKYSGEKACVNLKEYYNIY